MEDRRELDFEFCCIIDAAVEEVFAAITDKAAISTFFTDASSASLRTRRRSEGLLLRPRRRADQPSVRMA